MPDHYVIDGYNIIHAWDHYKKIRETSLDHARDKLIETLSNFAGASKNEVTVVFDAHLVKAGYEKFERINNVNVYYTGQDETADSLIERLVGELLKKSRVFVVTYDWDEQKIIFGRGAYRLTPKELLTQIKKMHQETKRHAKSSRPADDYLENRLDEEVRKKFEQWRRQKQ
ncbi:NYN domain-containing protein [Peptococcaceae bacterium 1198_IL3148]